MRETARHISENGTSNERVCIRDKEAGLSWFTLYLAGVRPCITEISATRIVLEANNAQNIFEGPEEEMLPLRAVAEFYALATMNCSDEVFLSLRNQMGFCKGVPLPEYSEN